VVCGLLMRLSVLTLRLAPSAEPARHMTENVLPGSGFSARTPNVQLFKYEHLYYTTKDVVMQQLKRQKLEKGLYPRATAPGVYALSS
jgi:hypothetical protein